ncbi:phosphoribosylglycinamide formyltransferase [Parasphingorhabdus halotolerans]|uniref:Phosphoribosylglycinamide formyltransferase n=1 Tax=Parasphingorhabdus halotolerans TaxID=2725558 RepID=A0A6H2DS11_9SPHN|nr:phosphoribosylglycinamide formyltransferase [Parasphingorhabdus halotolerans]QJB70551.1 phosphoribosylglycinamide formyltransferase [Parasphingorhabdus halotolerans]
MTPKAKIAILISGRGSNMAALIYAAKAESCPYEVVLVASNAASARGLELAEAEDIATFSHPHKGLSREDHDEIMHQAVINSGAEYIVLAGYMRILSDAFVSKWQDRMLNIHPSLLPKYKGLDTYARAIEAGDKVAGCSVHLVTPELDDGPVLAQTEVAILPGDNADRLASRVLIAEHQLYPNTLAKYVTREADPDWILEQVRRRALALTETHERMSFGSPGWRVGSEKTGKYFAYFTQKLHGEASVGLLVKTTGFDEQSALLEADPELYYLPKFYGKGGWIAIRLDIGRTDWDHVGDWLAKSWRMVAPKRLTKIIDIADQF